MHKHMGDDLPWTEKRRTRISPSKPRDGLLLANLHGGEKKQNVDDDEVAYNQRDVLEH